jgi:hypothetical protein
MIHVIYQKGFWSGLWTSIKMQAHYVIMFTLEMVALGAVAGILCIPFGAIGWFMMNVAPEHQWVGYVLMAPGAFIGLCICLLGVADSYLYICLFARSTATRYDFGVFSDCFTRSWNIIWQYRLSVLLLTAISTAYCFVVGGIIGLLESLGEGRAVLPLLTGLSAIIVICTLPVLVFIGVFLLDRLSTPETSGGAAQEATPTNELGTAMNPA